MKYLKKFNEDLENRDPHKHTGYDEDGHSLNYQGNILPLKKSQELETIEDKFNNWCNSIDYTEADYTSFKAGYESAHQND